MPAKTNRREFLQLAKTFKWGKDNPAGMYIAEKYDGSRAWWDGGITRGMPTTSVPWANLTNPETGERKAKIKPISTGLWSRYGNPINAPDWWLNQLPPMFLDGELFAGRGKFQTLRSIVARDVPDERWHQVRFVVFSTPSPGGVFKIGEIKNKNFHLDVKPAVIKAFMHKRIKGGPLQDDFQFTPSGMTFEQELHLLQGAMMGGNICYLAQHILLDEDRSKAEKHLESFTTQVYDAGGEGVVLRDPESIWTPKRVAGMLKLKPFNDDHGVVTGFISGRETDKGSKLLGLIGAVVLSYQGKRLELSGFTHEERKFDDEEFTTLAGRNPGQEMAPDTQGKYFKVGDKVEFRYRELTDDGIPKEARYYRRV